MCVNAYPANADSSSGESFYAFDALSGKLLWRVKSQTSFGSPVIFSGLDVVYTSDSYYIDTPEKKNGTMRALSLKSGELIWNVTLPDNYNPLAPAVLDGRLFVAGAGATLTALDALTGELLWSHAQRFSSAS